MNVQRLILTLLLLAAAVLALPSRATAAGASHWTHTTEADFKSGTLHNVVATNLGDLKLSRAVKMLLEQDAHVSAVYALAQGKDGTIYAGTGPKGIILAIKDDKVSTLATLEDDLNIFSLLIDKDGRVLAGTGGENGKIFSIKAGEKPKEIFAAEGVQYIWAMAQTPDGFIYAATGPEGQLFEIDPDGSHKVLFDSTESNLLSLLSDGKDTLYVGTDPNGLVYRINRKTKESFVLYDAAEAEVSALALDKKGNLYAGTAETSEGPTQNAEEGGAAEQVGRPESQPSGVAIPSKPPEAPKPPALPDPNPGEPAPIPKEHHKVKWAPSVSTRRALVAPIGWAYSPTIPHPAPQRWATTPTLQDFPTRAPVIFAEMKQDAANPHKPNPPASSPEAADGEEAHTLQPRQPKSGEAVKPRAEGNAIYRIDPDGFVTEIFRQPVLVLSLLENNGVLLVGTGSEGLVYQIDPAAEETTILAKVDPKQVMCLLPAADGRIFMGLANTGAVAAMSSGFASDGTWTSPVLDASQTSRFGKMQLHGTLPTDTALTVATRSGNMKEAGEAGEVGGAGSGWSKWSDEIPASAFLQVSAPTARFLQYRLTFTSKEGKETPVVQDVDVAYQVPNLAPQIKTIKIASAQQAAAEGDAAGAAAGAGAGATAKVASTRMQTITWEASDPNNDTLQYALYFRAGTHGQWVLLKEKIKEVQFVWDTRTIADGAYEVKVVASDAAANPHDTGKTASRISDPVVVDNTPPAIGDLTSKAVDGGIQIDCKAVDHTSTVANVEYSVDSNDDWQAVEASDKIFDSPEETVTFTVGQLTPGAHQITIRATDSHGNQAYESLSVNTEPREKHARQK